MNNEIQEAQDSFQQSMKCLGLDKLKIMDDGQVIEGVNALAMALPDMWLPRLMMRADNVSRLLDGKRMYTCGFAVDEKTLTGVKAANMTPEQMKEYGYPEIEVLKGSLAKQIYQYVTSTSILNKNGFAQLRQFNEFSLTEPEDEFVRWMPNELLVASALKDFSESAGITLDRILEHNQQLEIN